MDTRTKILAAGTAADVLAKEPDLLPVRLEFDPLYAAQANALRQLDRSLLAIIAAKPEAYLGLGARAQMAASLACVRYVTLDDHALPGMIDLAESDRKAQEELEQLVLAKQKLAAG